MGFYRRIRGRERRGVGSRVRRKDEGGSMKDETKKTVSVFGLGLIGSIWAKHLDDAGLLAASWNRTPKPGAPKSIPMARETAEKSNVLIIVVADPAAVQQIIESIRPALTHEHLVIQSSTIGPSDSTRYRKLVTASGARYIEAPFTGSKPAAEAKKTVFFLGGDAEVIALAEPVLSVFSAQRIFCGTGEQTCTIKLAMNLQFAAMTEALCEALFLCRKAEINDDTFFTVMKSGAAWSPFAAMKEPKFRTGDFSPQFSVKHMLKDMRLLRENNGSQPALDLMIERLEKAERDGLRDEDYTAILKTLS
jgi:3-hydroxyisobutyrate dehydrogenase-like beta-hydroxyacid dehydrogenase